MPRPDGGRGNLLIEFEVGFPAHIPREQREVIRGILEGVEKAEGGVEGSGKAAGDGKAE